MFQRLSRMKQVTKIENISWTCIVCKVNLTLQNRNTEEGIERAIRQWEQSHFLKYKLLCCCKLFHSASTVKQSVMISHSLILIIMKCKQFSNSGCWQAIQEHSPSALAQTLFWYPSMLHTYKMALMDSVLGGKKCNVAAFTGCKWNR